MGETTPNEPSGATVYVNFNMPQSLEPTEWVTQSEHPGELTTEQEETDVRPVTDSIYRLRKPSNESDFEKCFQCRGSGKFAAEKCDQCGGDGLGSRKAGSFITNRWLKKRDREGIESTLTGALTLP